MRFRSITMFMVIAAAVVSVGCSDDKFNFEVSDITDVVKKDEPTKVTLVSKDGNSEGIPEGLEFMGEEFAEMNLDMSADIATVTRDGYAGMDASSGRTVELEYPEITAYTPDGRQTTITSQRALVIPSKKLVRFSNGVEVSGPTKQVIYTDELTWHYTEASITINAPYTLQDGTGVIKGERLKTDIAFTYMDVE